MIDSGILFNDIHSYKDLNLILTEINIPPATPQTKYVEIPGSNEQIDLSEWCGEIKYNIRECKFTFVVKPDEKVTFEEKKSNVCNILNGKICKILFDEDCEFYYLGRVVVDGYMQKGNLKQITVYAKVDPYKLKNENTVVSTSVSGTKEITCINLQKSVVPEITATGDFDIEFEGNSYAISAGENIVVPDIKFVAGDNILKCTGTGTITFTYQEGSL